MSEDNNRHVGGAWNPRNGKVMEIEFDTRLLSDIRKFAEEDGVNSLYQEIRNICWRYVQARKNGIPMEGMRREVCDTMPSRRSRSDIQRARIMDLYRKRITSDR